MKKLALTVVALSLIALVVLVSSPVLAAPPVWVLAPKPKFPAAALNKGSEGYVILQTYIGREGSVTRATIARSSGDAILDDAARTAVLKWKMNPTAIKPEFRTKGYQLRIDFRQEAPVAAHYRDRRAYFNTPRDAKIFTYAPFPDYPFHERLVRAEGVALVRIWIGADGRVVSAELLKSSGNANLDKAAVSALRSWRAHKEHAGLRVVIPVRFRMESFR